MINLRKALMVIVALSALTIATGCNEASDKEVDVASKVNIKGQNFCEEVAEVMCANIHQCCTGMEIETSFGIKISTTQKECQKDVKLYCEEQTAEMQFSINEGRVSINDEQVEECLKSYVVKDDVCFPIITEYLEPCDESMYTPNQEAGDQCLFAHDCAGNTFCGANQICTAYKTLGEECSSLLKCADEFYCGFDETADTNKCMARKPELQGCAPGQCKTNHICKQNSDLGIGGDYGTCLKQKDIDESCDLNAECLSGYCRPGICSETGDACFQDDDCDGVCVGERQCDHQNYLMDYCNPALIDSFNLLNSTVPHLPTVGIGGGDEEWDTSEGCNASTEYTCFDMSCIPLSYLCDGYSDCTHGDDEIGCDTDTETETETETEDSCNPSTEYTCQDGECIPLSYVCDDYTDCNGSEDETGCDTGTGFDTDTDTECDILTQYTCQDGQCIASSSVCNDVTDCTNGEDELACDTDTGFDTGTVPCNTNTQWTCDNGACIDVLGFCDGSADCSDGSDETSCF